jgi:FMN phosphatase YigB (HAD superfamily)
MKVGLDFDNTIVCYDGLFHALAVERGLIPPETPTNKTAVRDYLRSVGREDDWTELQGIGYGPEIVRAEPYPGVLEFLHACRRRGIPVVVISHKTKHPYRGPQHDLHSAARSFLERHGFMDTAKTGLTDDSVFLELTKEAKLARIGTAVCTHFVDDLPEFLGEAAFPSGVNRILFDPDARYADDPRWRRVRDWHELSSLESGTAEPAAAAVVGLLKAAGLPEIGFQLDFITGGGNNRGYRLTTADGRRVFLKWYFRHPDDPRDRLGTEYAFISFCRRHGIDDVPQPLARDDAAGLALYEFIDGRRLSPAEVDDSAVATAIEFFRRLNTHRADPGAAALPIASEACFSVDQHLERIERRVQSLVAAAAASDDADFRDFVDRQLTTAWREVRKKIGGEATLLGSADRCLSPSDFGFHNAMRQPNGRLRFIDLEYAGWDDPAKTICDFFCQVQVPVSIEHWPRTAAALATATAQPQEFERRAAQLLPAYRIKWCCIVLNVFLPTGSARRSFGTAQAATAERRAAQLQKAHEVLARLPQDLFLAP